MLFIVRGKWEQIKQVEYVGVRELADAAEQALKEIGSSQEKGTVTEYPNERTIRFYITEGLLPPSEIKQGAASVFGYSHLLTLLAIKQLQSDGLPISIIRQLVIGKTVAELEELLSADSIGVRVVSDPLELQEAVSGSEAQLTEPYGEPERTNEDHVAADGLRAQKGGGEAREFLKGLLTPGRRRKNDAPSLLSRSGGPSRPTRTAARNPAAGVPHPSSKGVENWSRRKIAPGVEIHIRDGYKPPGADEATTRLLEKIKEALGIQRDR
ncbi:MAG: hypothetical protein UZ17_ACD001002157 [Acidobacteria bacterium OLB17]|nr:MAG: hypothetical protein UZ17_ACD001002157 [Acidobacteria bacterium OLB17]